MSFKAGPRKIAEVAVLVIIALCIFTIILIFAFGAERVYPIFMGLIRNEYTYGLAAILIAIPLSHFRRGLAIENRNEWLQKYGVTNGKVSRQIYCNKFNLLSNVLLYIYHITGSDKLGEPLEVYLAVDRHWSVKDIVWVTKPLKV